MNHTPIKRRRSLATAFKSWKNTSDFPDDWAVPVCAWIARRFQMPDGTKEIIIRNTSRGGHGHAGGRRVVCSIARRGFRSDWKYSTTPWGRQYDVATPLEAFVMLAAHELYHVSPEGRALIDRMERSGRHDWRQGMEERTQAAAWTVVEAYRLERRRFLDAYRKTLRTRREKRMKIDTAKAERRTPEYRLAKCERLLAAWQRKLRQAERRVKRYQTKINRGRAAIAARDRRIAASPSG